MFTQGQMGVTETLRILLTIFLSTPCIQNVRLFGVYDVRWPFLVEIHTAQLKRFMPSGVLQAVRALRNAPAVLAVFLAGVAPVLKANNAGPLDPGMGDERFFRFKRNAWNF